MPFGGDRARGSSEGERGLCTSATIADSSSQKSVQVDRSGQCGEVGESGKRCESDESPGKNILWGGWSEHFPCKSLAEVSNEDQASSSQGERSALADNASNASSRGNSKSDPTSSNNSGGNLSFEGMGPGMAFLRAAGGITSENMFDENVAPSYGDAKWRDAPGANTFLPPFHAQNADAASSSSKRNVDIGAKKMAAADTVSSHGVSSSAPARFTECGENTDAVGGNAAAGSTLLFGHGRGRKSASAPELADSQQVDCSSASEQQQQQRGGMGGASEKSGLRGADGPDAALSWRKLFSSFVRGGPTAEGAGQARGARGRSSSMCDIGGHSDDGGCDVEAHVEGHVLASGERQADIRQGQQTSQHSVPAHPALALTRGHQQNCQ